MIVPFAKLSAALMFENEERKRIDKAIGKSLFRLNARRIKARESLIMLIECLLEAPIVALFEPALDFENESQIECSDGGDAPGRCHTIRAQGSSERILGYG